MRSKWVVPVLSLCFLGLPGCCFVANTANLIQDAGCRIGCRSNCRACRLWQRIAYCSPPRGRGCACRSGCGGPQNYEYSAPDYGYGAPQDYAYAAGEPDAYMTSAGYEPVIPNYQVAPTYQTAPMVQTAPNYQAMPSFPTAPYAYGPIPSGQYAVPHHVGPYGFAGPSMGASAPPVAAPVANELMAELEAPPSPPPPPPLPPSLEGPLFLGRTQWDVAPSPPNRPQPPDVSIQQGPISESKWKPTSNGQPVPLTVPGIR